MIDNLEIGIGDNHSSTRSEKISTNDLQQIMYPPRRQAFEVKRKMFDYTPKYDRLIEGEEINRITEFEFNIKKQVYLRKDFDWKPEITKFFNILERAKNYQRRQLMMKNQAQINSFLQFQPTIQSQYSAWFCICYYTLVIENGGFIQILARNQLDQIVGQLNQLFDLSKIIFPTDIFFEIYRKHILGFQMYKKRLIKRNQPVDIDRVKYYTHDQIQEIKSNRLERTQLDRDVFVIENFAEYVGYDYNILNTEYFSKHYGNIQIDTRLQSIDAVGFDIFNTKMSHEEYLTTAAEYLQYQELEGTPQVKKLPIYKKLKPGQICFAVNVELQGKQDIQNQLKTKLNKFKFVQFLNQLDGLSYNQHLIPGCNQPQLYFKVKGVYTGGHQENVSMASVNVNFGPDDSEWYTLDTQHVDRMRQQVKKQFNIDIIDSQGLWFASPQWLIANNFPVKKLIQKKGDLVYSGPGTLHWVRSLGKCYQAAWNLFPKTVKQWREAMKRTKINYEIKFYQIFMPMKSLALKILNHQYKKQNLYTLSIQKSLIEWIQEQSRLIKSCIAISKDKQMRARQRYLPDIDSLCNFCRQQVFTIYSLDVQGQTVCLKCCAESKHPQIQYYKRYQIDDISELFNRIYQLRRLENIEALGEVEGLCCRIYSGDVNCSHKIKSISFLSEESEEFEEYEESEFAQNKEQSSQIQNKPQTNTRPILSFCQNVEFDKLIIGGQTPRIDFPRLFLMLHQAMPQCKWSNTQEVLRAQMNIITRNQQKFSQNINQPQSNIPLFSIDPVSGQVIISEQIFPDNVSESKPISNSSEERDHLESCQNKNDDSPKLNELNQLKQSTKQNININPYPISNQNSLSKVQSLFNYFNNKSENTENQSQQPRIKSKQLIQFLSTQSSNKVIQQVNEIGKFDFSYEIKQQEEQDVIYFKSLGLSG